MAAQRRAGPVHPLTRDPEDPGVQASPGVAPFQREQEGRERVSGIHRARWGQQWSGRSQDSPRERVLVQNTERGEEEAQPWILEDSEQGPQARPAAERRARNQGPSPIPPAPAWGPGEGCTHRTAGPPGPLWMDIVPQICSLARGQNLYVNWEEVPLLQVNTVFGEWRVSWF